MKTSFIISGQSVASRRDTQSTLLFVAVILITLFSSTPITAKQSLLNKELSRLVLSGKEGKTLDGQPWDSAQLKGKTSIIIYIDPDESELNDHVFEDLKQRRSSANQVRSHIIMNMAASWAPNILIERALVKHQEESPNSTFVVTTHTPKKIEKSQKNT